MAAWHIYSVHIALSQWMIRLSLFAGLSFVFGLLIGAASASTGELKRLGDAAAGSLMLESTTPGLYVEAPMVATDVKISVSGPIARTKVTQRFHNTSDAWVEGIYVFPLPDGAGVDTLKMQIGSRFIEGKIEERQKAKAIYEAAKREGKKASLLEQQRANIFTNAVANIGPGETVVVQIEYQDVAHQDGDTFSLRFPMVVGPRYNPAPVQTHLVSLDPSSGFGTLDPVPDRDAITPPVLHPDAGPINPVSLTVDLAAGFPLGEVRSSYHPVTMTDKAEGHRIISLKEESVPADKDFELTWTPAAGPAPSAALFHETVEGEDYYLVMLTPPKGADVTDIAEKKQPARDITFVIDTSGSMQGTSIRQARDSLAMAVKRLKAGDKFNIIQFNSFHEQLFPQSVAASYTNQQTALSYIQQLDASGGTEMLSALTEALSATPAKKHLRQVVFLTDGAIGNETQLFDTITRMRRDARIFMVGIGSAPNSFFMDRAAELGRGSATHIGDLSQVSARMSALFEKLENPAVTNLQTDWPGGATVEAWPAPIPDLYQGETLVVAAKASSTSGEVTISGTDGVTPWKAALPLDQAQSRSGIAKVWARKKIASLELLNRYPGADREAIDKAVLDVALTHGLVSRLTSLVAVDKTPSRPSEEPLVTTDVPPNLPAGWEFEAVFGGAATPAQMAPTAPMPVMRKAQADLTQMASAAPIQVGAGLALPRTATGWQSKVLLGLVLMLMSLMGWRWARR
ncbi:MAG: marine proteobacterial sortase target protein [Sphingomonadales bacterium]